MNIIVVEYLTQKGHANFYSNICKILKSGGCNVTALLPDDYPSKLEGCEIKYTGLKYYENEYEIDTGKNRLMYSLRVQKKVYNLQRKSLYNYVYVVTYDEVAFAVSQLLFKKKVPEILFQHNNIDNIGQSKIRRWCFEYFKKKVIHVVLASFIKSHVVTELACPRNKVIVLPHPMYKFRNDLICDLDCVGISNGNDEMIISQLIYLEKKSKIFELNNIKIVLKSKCYEYDDGYLKVFKGFIDSYSYDSLLARSRCIFMPFPIEFSQRLSGTLIDALSNDKPVISTPIMVSLKAAECYPNSVRIYDAENFVQDILYYRDLTNNVKNELSYFRDVRDVQNLARILIKGVECANNGVEMMIRSDF